MPGAGRSAPRGTKGGPAGLAEAADLVDVEGPLRGVVGRALGRPVAGVGDWAATSLRRGPGSATVGVWRVQGELPAQEGAPSGDGRQPWSVVLKVLRNSSQGHPNWMASDDVSDPYYWRREALAYGSGLLDRLRGDLHAPRCLGVSQGRDAVAFWIEDVHGTRGQDWPIARYGAAARHLGQAQGEFLAGRRLPRHRWLCRGWLRAYVERHGRHLPLAGDDRLWAHPLVSEAFPEPLASYANRTWADRERWLDVVDRAPLTLCHNDVCPKNLLAVGDGGGSGPTVLIDWAFLGIGPVAHDVANLVFDSLMDLAVDASRCVELHETVVDEYLGGLADAGWRPEEPAIRRVFGAMAALKYQWMVPYLLRSATDPDRLARFEHSYNRPVGEVYAARARVLYFLRDLVLASEP